MMTRHSLAFICATASVLRLVGAQLAAEDDVPTTTVGPTVCKKDETGPDFIPNVYECKNSERCCENQGVPSCCSTEVSNDAIVEQAIMWGSLIGVLVVVGVCASCYFKDRYCCDSEDGGCCGRKKEDEKYASRFNFQETLYPDEVKANQVDDPIFGRTGRANDVPQFASVDNEALRQAQLFKKA